MNRPKDMFKDVLTMSIHEAIRNAEQLQLYAITPKEYARVQRVKDNLETALEYAENFDSLKSNFELLSSPSATEEASK